MNQMQQAQIYLPSEGGLKSGKLDDFQSIIFRNVEHELRTPLTIIQGYAEVLRDGDLGALTPEQQKAILTIVDHAYELQTIVERISILMVIETHKTVLQPLTLDEVFAEVVERKRAEAKRAGLTLELHLEPDLPPVLGNPYQLQQTINCLLENALKFTPGGGQVEAQVYTKPGWVCLAVTDTGIGIAGEQLERIFTPFYQVDSSTTRQYGGIGLGLTVVKAIVEAHRGRIEVESQLGQGSRFTVKLPALLSDALVDQPHEEDAGALRRILIADDDESVALFFQAILEEIPNCEVAVATDGEQAAQLFEEQPFDLLITDYRMPGTDGIELAVRVRQLYPQTIIVMITAYGSDELREQADRASIRRFLDKPVGLTELRDAVLEVLDRPENRQEGAYG
jgi:two-component system sensor histidine kinase/response regulator